MRRGESKLKCDWKQGSRFACSSSLNLGLNCFWTKPQLCNGYPISMYFPPELSMYFAPNMCQRSTFSAWVSDKYSNAQNAVLERSFQFDFQIKSEVNYENPNSEICSEFYSIRSIYYITLHTQCIRFAKLDKQFCEWMNLLRVRTTMYRVYIVYTCVSKMESIACKTIHHNFFVLLLSLFHPNSFAVLCMRNGSVCLCAHVILCGYYIRINGIYIQNSCNIILSQIVLFCLALFLFDNTTNFHHTQAHSLSIAFTHTWHTCKNVEFNGSSIRVAFAPSK